MSYIKSLCKRELNELNDIIIVFRDLKNNVSAENLKFLFGQKFDVDSLIVFLENKLRRQEPSKIKNALKPLCSDDLVFLPFKTQKFETGTFSFLNKDQTYKSFDDFETDFDTHLSYFRDLCYARFLILKLIYFSNEFKDKNLKLMK